MDKFDLLVVYSAKLAHSAGCKRFDIVSPFMGGKNESYNTVYGYFMKICKSQGLTAAFTTSADIIGPGRCQDYWLYKNNKWVRVNKVCYSKVIFDKFSPTNKLIKKRRKLLFSDPAVTPFNNPYIYDLFFDKQKTYQRLRKFSIPTVTIQKNTLKEIDKALTNLTKLIKAHPSKMDFTDKIVVKDRFGSGGFDVYKSTIRGRQEISGILKKHNSKSFIIQPLVNFDKGFVFDSKEVSADIRLIHLDGTFIQTYIRMAKGGDFRCNEHQGGTLKYFPKTDVPSIVLQKSRQIVKALNRNSSLIALDFIIGNSGNVYLLEGNTGPGLDWNLLLAENEREAKKLIRMVVKKLGLTANQNSYKKVNKESVPYPLANPIVPSAISYIQA